MIGSSLAQNIEHTNKNDIRNYQVQQKNYVAKYKKSRKVKVFDEYKVTYRSQGKFYRNFRQNKPAKYIGIYD
ncbi:MAG: hypothetical protein ACI9UT_000633 [Flavobacteriales bacterium]|jgi:hypothetical protein